MISAVIFYLLAKLFPGTIAAVLLKMGAIVGIGFAATNGIPLHLPGIDNDGANIVSMRKSPEAVKMFYNQLKVSELGAKGMRLKEMPEELFTVPENADMENSLVSTIAVMNEERLADMGLLSDADEEAKRLLELEKGIVGLYRSLLTCDRISFAVIKGEDPSPFVTKELNKFMKSMKDYPSVIRTEYLLALKDNDKEKAEKALRRFEKISLSYPNSGDLESERQLMEIGKDKLG